MRFAQIADISDYEKYELSQLRLGARTVLYAPPSFPDDVEGITAPSDEPYTLRVQTTPEAWTFELIDPDGQVGVIVFPTPEQMGQFEVDPRFSDMRSQGDGPLLYKEWRLKGSVELSGIVGDTATMANATFVLQGRGNGCTAASDFSDWTLEVSGPGVNFTLLGALASASDGGETSTSQPADYVTDTFSCADGSTFKVRFDNGVTYSLAVLMLKDQAEIPLIQAPSGSGVLYSNGEYTLQTKADEAVLMRGDKLWRCETK